MDEVQSSKLIWKDIINQSIEEEIKKSYIEYAMAVIVSRALPDTRDWFKPVLRRILYAMYDMKMFHNSKHKKSARIVWEVLWKYHPHWDTSVYYAMARMAQEWSLRYPLVDWQWNFWSIDWDWIAAMRYTEARLTKLAEEMCADIEQDTVNWRDNFDWSLREPIVLPTKFPNHLCNWTMWIAVWMATNMAPHNLKEVIDACLMLIEKEWKIIPQDSREIIKPVLLIDAVYSLINENDWELSLNTDLADFINLLPGRKIVVTNANIDKIKPLLDWYDFDIYTLNFKPEKTSEKYFQKLINDKNIDLNYVYYFDHSQENLDSARKAWIKNVKIYLDNSQIKDYLNFIKDKLEDQQPDIYNITVDDIMEIIKWPDFPTWWYIFNSDSIKQVYKKWKWWVVMRWNVDIETDKKWERLIITEIPYMVNKSTLVSRIWELVVNKIIDWVSDIRDESSKNKIRVVIYLKKWANKQKILIQLYKYTELQSNFNINNVSLVENWKQPILMNIKDLLMEFVDFRREVVYRRSKYQLDKAKARLHILEWLKKAIDIIDDVISTIRNSQTKWEAKIKMIEKFWFSEEQAEYILMLRLQSLVWLEIDKISDEIDEKHRLIEYLTSILNDSEKLDWVVIEELSYIKEKYWDDRRTKLLEDDSIYNLSKKLKNLWLEADREKEDVIFWLWDDYSIKVLYQSRILSVPDNTIDLVYTHNQDNLIIITDIWELVVQRLKDFWRFSTNWISLDLKSHFKLKWNIIFTKTLHFHYDYLVLLTNKNSIKKIKKEIVLSFKKFPTTIMKLWRWEIILNVLPTKQWDKIWILTKMWWMLLFDESEVRAMWKTAWWVKAVSLEDEKNDKVTNMFLYKWEPFVFIHSDKKWKLLNIDDLRVRKRAKRTQKIMIWDDCIKWWISIEEWSVRFKCEDWSLITIHSNDIHLDEPETELREIVKKTIKIVYKPWEELSENVSYKEEKKKKNWLFDEESKK